MPKGNKHAPALATSSSDCPHCVGLELHANTPGARKACKDRVAKNGALRARVEAHKKSVARAARGMV